MPQGGQRKEGSAWSEDAQRGAGRATGQTEDSGERRQGHRRARGQKERARGQQISGFTSQPKSAGLCSTVLRLPVVSSGRLDLLVRSLLRNTVEKIPLKSPLKSPLEKVRWNRALLSLALLSSVVY